jgi:hypothetical protein
LRVALDEPGFKKLVGGEVVALETVDGQQVRLILSDIGWGRIFAAVAEAAAKREGPKLDG